MDNEAYRVLQWNEVARLEVRGERLALKDAMIMLDADDTDPGWPFVVVSPGRYVAEIHLPSAWHCTRFRVRKVGAEPVLGTEIGQFDVDHGKACVVDYDTFRASVAEDIDEYEEWMANELDDELALNFSGEIAFCDTSLIYVKSGNGDGTYPAFELVEGEKIVGVECSFDGAGR